MLDRTREYLKVPGAKLGLASAVIAFGGIGAEVAVDLDGKALLVACVGGLGLPLAGIIVLNDIKQDISQQSNNHQS
jgi:hypothetical protein